MTPQENEALVTLLGQLSQVRGVSKDPQADSLIQAAAAQQPDALYLLVQRTMLLDQALAAAKQQASELQARLDAGARQAAPATTSFLDANAWGNGAASSTTTLPPFARAVEQEVSVTGRPLGTMDSQSPPSSPAQQDAGRYPGSPMGSVQPGSGSVPQRGGFLGAGAGSMLGTVAATAAGVAGGAFLFQGIGSLLGNHHPAASVADSGSKSTDHDAGAAEGAANSASANGGADGGAAGHAAGSGDQHTLADSSGDDALGNASWDDLSGVDSGLSSFDDDGSVI